MEEIIEITDINGRKKFAIKNSIKIIDHEVRDAIHGGTITEKYVEVIIVGKHRNRRWKEWYPLKEFIARNPNLLRM